MRSAASILAMGAGLILMSLPLLRADDATPVNSSQATAEAQQQIAEAQAMADAALARAAQADGTTTAAPMSNRGSTHHTVSDLIQNNSLRPDHSDPKHHRMGELL